MKVLLVSSGSGSRGGGEIFLLYLGEGLRAAGHEPVLWCPSHERMDELAGKFEAIGEVRREAYDNSYLDRRLRVISALADRAGVRRLAESFAGFEGDLIHLNKQTVEDGLDLGAALDRSGKPWVSTVHITQGNRELGAKLGGVRDALGEGALRRQGREAPIAVSDTRRRTLEARLGREVASVYNGVPEGPEAGREERRHEVLQRFSWDANVFLVVCVARLEPQKNPSRFLKLAAQLAKVSPQARFVWVGDG
ncbi:MAG: glycosyltransferase, partial [Verrucomicrobiales bacterium]